jgi:hypothetical protein
MEGVAQMKKMKYEPTNIQPNLDNRGKTLRGCEKNTYDSEPEPPPIFGFLMMPTTPPAPDL